MTKPKASEKWVDAGYQIFAQEGLEGIQIERMARILSLNKSSFYHYFGTQEIFLERMVAHHHSMADLLIADFNNAACIDPDILQAVINHKVTIMAQVQLTRHKSNPSFFAAARALDERIDRTVLRTWKEYIGVLTNDDLAYRYCGLVRDMFYTKISFENFTFPFLRELATSAREIAEQLVKEGEMLSKAKGKTTGNAE